jgi:23S rRNA (uracil1939-C5)-methyltransferase
MQQPHGQGSPDEVVVRIDSLAYGRAGVGRVGGKVVFVEGSAPGDLVRARHVRDHAAYVEAELIDVVEPGAARTTAPCPIVRECGGCPWQHVSYTEQLRAKRQSVIDALRRIGGIDEPPVRETVPSPRELGYRNRLRLRFEGGRLGFYRARSHALVAIRDCQIADDRIRASLACVEGFVATLATAVKRVEIASRGELPGVVAALNSEGRLRRADAHRVRDFLAQPGHAVTGVTMWGRGWRRRWGDVRRRFAIDAALSVEAPGASFGQVNTEANRLLVAAALEAAEPRASDRVLDLYAGAGNFSLPLAARAARVDAVEADVEAVEAGRRSAAHQGLHNVFFHAARAQAFLEGSADLAPDIVVADPPRDGLLGTVDAIARLRAPRLVYVSCNPTTLARDVVRLRSHGYTVRCATPLDLFPHTFHVEIVCDARLT